MKSALLSLLIVNQFAGLENEDPYNHLTTFYEFCSTIGISREDEEATCLRLFQFSLIGKAKIWLQSQPNQSLVNREDVERKFLS